MPRLKKSVFFPPLLLIAFTIVFSQVNYDLFSLYISKINTWILQNVGFLFSWSSFVFLFLLLIAYFSPLSRITIGGKGAKPLLSRPRWFAISICTTIATGILFWGCAEPLYHYNAPPISSIVAQSPEATNFSMSTLFMHWSLTPYGIYCLAGLVFALSYYNRKQAFSVSSLIGIPQEKQSKTLRSTIDVLCLYALVLGMAASLGTGIYSISGGLEKVFGLSRSNGLLAFVGMVIMGSFILSAISGLQKGIKLLSSINIAGFILLATFIFITGYPLEVIELAYQGLTEYLSTFAERSIQYNTGVPTKWANDWTVFYWANWFAWAPVAALFLGKIAKGYTVRQYINFNLLYPALFAIVWMSIFSGSTLHINTLLDNELLYNMQNKGEESVMYDLLENLSFSQLSIPITLFLIFLSYVTAADSNISAMSKMSEISKEDTEAEASIYTKISWGLVIGLLTYIMISTKGVDGIRTLAILGGFPALFIIIAAAISLIIFILRPPTMNPKNKP